ncbi:GFA family protein [Streptomyces sp. me109]|uniref:GFA family protein n=1 Tax=Streptomyces sp. me109 TaxID=1827853 RepID=UPI0011CE99EC|nr:GFA family protein [Streptomyces sp. me109]TXS52367.1 GFA family protein [Streptomyces sp. me109]
MNATSDIVAAIQERSGGCLCGRIRFTVKGRAVYPHTCSCPHCKKLGGGPMMWWAGFATDDVTWTNGIEPTWFETFEGEAQRSFCPHCGSRLAAIDSDVPELGIVVTALDDTSGADLVPVNQSFRDDAVHWLPQVPDTQNSPVG